MIDISMEDEVVNLVCEHAMKFAQTKIASSSVKLLIGRRNANKTVEVDQVKVSTDIKEEIFELANIAMERLQASSFPKFSETQILEDDECFVKEVLLNSVEEQQDISMVADDVLPEAETVASLVSATQLAVRSTGRLGLDDIKSKQFTFYVVAAKTDNDEDIYLVKRQRGFKVAVKGRIFTRYADGLQRLDDPIFGLAYDFDFIIFKDFIFVWSVDSFYSLFMDVEELQKSIPAFVESITIGLGITVSPAALIYVSQSAEGSIRKAQQVRRIAGSGWLHMVNSENLVKAINELDAETHAIKIDNEGVTFEPEDVDIFLSIVEQRIYRGKFDGKTRQSQASKTL